MATRKNTKKDYIFAVGRRRTAVARVRLHSGHGENLVNGKLFSEYFPGAASAVSYLLPFVTTNTEGKYWVSAKVAGGGKNGQLEALVHGISRTLVLANEEVRPALKKHSLLTRDSRKRQRRRVGKAGKSRKQKSSPKR
jgi:small subunit ribosomal protein S9